MPISHELSYLSNVSQNAIIFALSKCLLSLDSEMTWTAQFEMFFSNPASSHFK